MIIWKKHILSNVRVIFEFCLQGGPPPFSKKLLGPLFTAKFGYNDSVCQSNPWPYPYLYVKIMSRLLHEVAGYYE